MKIHRGYTILGSFDYNGIEGMRKLAKKIANFLPQTKGIIQYAENGIRIKTKGSIIDIIPVGTGCVEVTENVGQSSILDKIVEII